jgi:hypothetical protein
MQKYGVDNDQKQRRRTKALAGEYRITRQRPEPVKADKAISHSKKEGNQKEQPIDISKISGITKQDMAI